MDNPDSQQAAEFITRMKAFVGTYPKQGEISASITVTLHPFDWVHVAAIANKLDCSIDEAVARMVGDFIHGDLREELEESGGEPNSRN